MKFKIPRKDSKLAGIKIPTIRKWIRSLKPALKKIKDPRGKQGKKYPLDYVLELYLISCLAGYCDCLNCVEFLESKLDIISQFIPKARELGIPSHDCFCDCLAIVEEEQMRDLLKEFNRLNSSGLDKLPVIIKTQGIDWIKEEENYHKNGRPYNYQCQKREVLIRQHICMDGKASRGATDKKRDGKIPYTGGFYNATVGHFADVVYIPNGKEEGEATVLRQALSQKNLIYTITTADALNTKEKTIKTIRDRLGEFLFRLKPGSHPKEYELIIGELEVSKEEAEIDRKRLESARNRGEVILTPALERYQEKTFIETDKARLIKTTIRSVIDDNNICSEYSPYIAQIIHLKSETTELIKDENRETVSSYECCFICSCILDIDDIYRLICEHWHIESAHWILDNYFNEDRSTGRAGHQIYNRALFKRLAFNFLKLLEKCVIETAVKSTKNKFIFLRKYFEIAIMLVNGLEKNYYLKMAEIYNDRKKAYFNRQKEVDLSKITLVTM